MACTASALGLGASSLFHLSRTIGVAPFAQTGTAVVRSRGWEVYSLLLCLCNVVAVNYMSVTVYNTLTGSFYTDMIGMSYITKGTCAWCLHLVSLARRVHVARAFNSILRYEALGCWPADEPRRGRPRARRRLWGRLWGRLRGRCGSAVVVWVQLLAISSVCLWTFALSWSYHVKQTLLEKVGKTEWRHAARVAMIRRYRVKQSLYGAGPGRASSTGDTVPE